MAAPPWDQVVDIECGKSFLTAFAARDWAALEAVFASEAQLRAVIPKSEHPFRDRTGAAACANQIRVWFQDADVFEILDSDVTTLVDRVHLQYRVRVHEPEGWSIVEQHLYLTPGADGIRFCNLLCSGFRPIPDPTEEAIALTPT